jgi:hypothetical protein
MRHRSTGRVSIGATSTLALCAAFPRAWLHARAPADGFCGAALEAGAMQARKTASWNDAALRSAVIATSGGKGKQPPPNAAARSPL